MDALLLTSIAIMAPVSIDHVKVEVGDGTVIEDTTVVLDGDRILSLGKPAPQEAQHIDGRGKALTPGLAEVLCQLGLTEVGMEKRTNDDRLKASTLTPGFRAPEGFNPLSPRIPISREGGVTSAITGPDGNGIIFGTGNWFDLTGLFSSRPDPSHPTAMFGAVGSGAAQSSSGARGGIWLALRQLVDDTRYYQRNRAAYDRGNAHPLSLSPLHLAAFLPVLEGRLPLVLEADRASDILTAIQFAEENGIRLVIASGTEAWRVADRLAAKKIPVILHPSMQLPYSYESLLARDDAATLLWKAGVPVIISAGDFDQNIRRLRQEAGVAVAWGLPHEEALRAITSRPAEVFGKAAELGTVAAGKRANVVLWSGDPFELSSRAERIWIDGTEQSHDNRQRQLVRRYFKEAEQQAAKKDGRQAAPKQVR